MKCNKYSTLIYSIRKKILLISIICLCGCMNNSPQKACMNKASNEWKFIFTEKVKYFMNLHETERLHVVFEYYNDTKEPQLIDTVKTTCSCINVVYPHNPILPYDRGSVSLYIDISNVNIFYRTIIVYFKGKTPVVLKVVGRKEDKRVSNINI